MDYCENGCDAPTSTTTGSAAAMTRAVRACAKTLDIGLDRIETIRQR